MTRDYWTPEHEQRLRDLYADHPTEDIASELGRPVHKVLAKAWRMGLRKSRECIARIARAFGHHPNTRATQFKPGAKPHTWVPVGSLRVKDGMLEIKYSDDKGSQSRRWRSYATNVWMQAHGPVPPGFLVVFRPGQQSIDPAAITLDKIECISRADNMARNTMHRLPKDLARVIQLRGVLTRAINSHRKGHQE